MKILGINGMNVLFLDVWKQPAKNLESNQNGLIVVFMAVWKMPNAAVVKYLSAERILGWNKPNGEKVVLKMYSIWESYAAVVMRA